MKRRTWGKRFGKRTYSAMDCDSASSFLTERFGRTIHIVGSKPAPGGANNGTHFVAISDVGEEFGFKAAIRQDADGTKREYLIWQLASNLAAPFAPKSFLVQGEAWMADSLPGKEVVVCEWLFKAKKVGEVVGQEIEAALGPDLWNQVGEWIPFCLAFRIDDRGLSNWVWSNERKQISIIDTEDCLRADTVTVALVRDFVCHFPKLREFATCPSEGRTKHLEGLEMLVSALRMNDKIHKNMEGIRGLLKEFGYEAYQSEWLGKSSGKLLQELFQI